MNPPSTPDDAPGLSSRPEEPERLPDEIDDDTLRKYFTLTKLDLAQVDQCRGPTNKFGFARSALYSPMAWLLSGRHTWSPLLGH